jgi:hypothetical protein
MVGNGERDSSLCGAQNDGQGGGDHYSRLIQVYAE